MVESQPAAKRHCPAARTLAPQAIDPYATETILQRKIHQPNAQTRPILLAPDLSRTEPLDSLASSQRRHPGPDAAEVHANPAETGSVQTVKLPGREVNIRRAELWEKHDTDDILFDVKLIASDRAIHCNRFILAEESSFFEKRFHSPEFKESSGEISLEHIDGSILLAILGSLFTAEIKLGHHNLNKVLQWAHYLKVSAVEAACGKFIEESLCEKTVPQALWLTQRYDMEDLKAAVLQYTMNNFFLMHRTSLEGIDESELFHILSSDSLIVFSEMQIYRAVAAWIEHHAASTSFMKLFGVVRLHHIQPFEARSLLAEPAVKQHPAASAAITESILNRLEGRRSLLLPPQRDLRRCVWVIDGWAEKRHQKTLRSPHFSLAGSDCSWLLSYTSDKAGFHLTCVGDDDEDDDGDSLPYSALSGQEAAEAMQLTMVLYHQSDYNRARRWRLPKRKLSPGEYQGFDWFFKDVEAWVRDDRIVVGVQLRLIGSNDIIHADDGAVAALPEALQRLTAAPEGSQPARTPSEAKKVSSSTISADSSDQDST